MKFYEFFLLCLNKLLVDNKSNFETFLKAFKKLAKDDEKLEFKQFPYLMTIVAKMLKPGEKRPILTLLNDYLGNKTKAVANIIQKPRTIHTDDMNKRLLHTKIVEVYIQHQEFLQNAFTLYYQTNYLGRIFFNWKELSLQNKKLSLHQFVQMLKDVHILPAKISKDTVSDMSAKIAVPCTKEEQDFYQDRKISELFELDTDPNGKTMMDGDPGLHYHEFVILLGRIALNIYRDDEAKEIGDSHELMDHFLQHKMKFDLIAKLVRPEGYKIDDDLFENRFVEKMVRFQVSKEKGEIDDKVRPPSPDPLDENIRRIDSEIRDSLNSEMAQVQEVISFLDGKLGAFPDPPEVPSEPKKKRQKAPVVLGEQVPVEKNANRSKQKPKPPRRKKDEKPIRFDGMPLEEPMMFAKKMTEYKKRLDAEKKLFKLNTGTLSDIEIDPVILKEVIYPQDPPSQKVIMHIEAGIQSQFVGRYVFAIRNLKLAREIWTQHRPLEPSDELFFQFMIGSIYESACRDDIALSIYRDCINIKGLNSIDKSLPYMGLGSVLYHSNEYKIAGRCFNKAIESRESFIGGNEPDTASAYNNFGCCLFKIERIQEAFNYFKLAELIFAAKLGPFHERTLVAKRNKTKCMKGDFKLDVPWMRPWKLYYHDKTSKIGIGGKRKGKKKRKG